MKCPRCGGELKHSKKDPAYGLCYNCKKKYKWKDEPVVKAVKKKAPIDDDIDYVDDDNEDEEYENQKYSNIPPKKVRVKRESRSKSAYQEMIDAGEDDDEGGHTGLIIFFIVVLLIIIACGVYYYINGSIPFSSQILDLIDKFRK